MPFIPYHTAGRGDGKEYTREARFRSVFEGTVVTYTRAGMGESLMRQTGRCVPACRND